MALHPNPVPVRSPSPRNVIERSDPVANTQAMLSDHRETQLKQAMQREEAIKARLVSERGENDHLRAQMVEAEHSLTRMQTEIKESTVVMARLEGKVNV
jgi:hypothetical protein